MFPWAGGVLYIGRSFAVLFEGPTLKTKHWPGVYLQGDKICKIVLIPAPSTVF